MSGIEIISAPARRTRAARPARTGQGQRRLNTITTWLLILVVVVAPLPLASARPALAGIWASWVGLVGVVYFGILVLRGETLRFPLRRLHTTAILLGLASLALVLQLLPVFPVPIPLPDGSSIASSQISIAPGMTVLMLCRQLSYALFALLILQVCVNDRRRGLVLGAILTSVVAYAAYALVALQSGDTILGMPKWAYFGSATGPMVNRNSFATYLGMGAVLALSMLASRIVNQADRHKDDGLIAHNFSTIMLLGIAYAFLLVTLISTQSRMGLAATLIASGVVVVLTLAAMRNTRLGGIAAFAFAGVLIAGLLLYGGRIFERLGSLEGATEVRGDFYRQVWELIMLRPLTGFGGGTFELAFPLVQNLPVSPDLVWQKAHNTYLSFWAELGLVAGTLPILAVALIAWRLLRNIVARRGSWRAQVAALAVIVLGGVHSLADFSLEIPANTFLFIALVAAGLAATPDVTQKQEPAQHVQ